MPSRAGHGRHEPAAPRRYDLQVWLSQANPSEATAQFNPNVTC